MGSKKPSKRVVQFLFTSRHTVPTSIPSSNYSPNLRRSCVKLPHILSRMPHSPSGASARPSPHVSIKSLELNALHISQIQDMVHLNGNRSKRPHGPILPNWPRRAAQSRRDLRSRHPQTTPTAFLHGLGHVWTLQHTRAMSAFAMKADTRRKISN